MALREKSYPRSCKPPVTRSWLLPKAQSGLKVLTFSRLHSRMKHISEVYDALGCAAPSLTLIVVGPTDLEAKVRLFELGVDD